MLTHRLCAMPCGASSIASYRQYVFIRAGKFDFVVRESPYNYDCLDCPVILAGHITSAVYNTLKRLRNNK
jgi:hypothetical protein